MYPCVSCKKTSLFSSSNRYRNSGLSGNEQRCCVYSVPLLLAAPNVIHEKNWKHLDVLEHFHQPILPWTPAASPAHLATHHSVIPRRHFDSDFRNLLIHATSFLVLMSPRSPFQSCLFWWDVVSGHSPNDNYTQILRRVFQVKELPVYFVYRCFFFCLHLAVGRHYHRRIFRYPRGLQFGFVKVFLTDHMHACSGIYHKLSFLGCFCGIHSSEGE